eukprot:GILK01007828.1.p1 GENE.GILK01007828.1~~GILK01007828.1.p1  ORF type:complete len:172 (+),score=16.28 GILK01007828.1:40-516(+)
MAKSVEPTPRKLINSFLRSSSNSRAPSVGASTIVPDVRHLDDSFCEAMNMTSDDLIAKIQKLPPVPQIDALRSNIMHSVESIRKRSPPKPAFESYTPVKIPEKILKEWRSEAVNTEKSRQKISTTTLVILFFLLLGAIFAFKHYSTHTSARQPVIRYT